jgi:hypothetical protein
MEELIGLSISFNSHAICLAMRRLLAETNTWMAEQPRDQNSRLVLEGRMVLGPKYWRVILHSSKRPSLLAPITQRKRQWLWILQGFSVCTSPSWKRRFHRRRGLALLNGRNVPNATLPLPARNSDRVTWALPVRPA